MQARYSYNELQISFSLQSHYISLQLLPYKMAYFRVRDVTFLLPCKTSIDERRDERRQCGQGHYKRYLATRERDEESERAWRSCLIKSRICVGASSTQSTPSKITCAFSWWSLGMRLLNVQIYMGTWAWNVKKNDVIQRK